MRIPCPFCGARDLREFTIRGAALRARPAFDAPVPDWDAYQHLRANPAGVTDEFWHHVGGCGAWLTVRRDTTTHRILGVWPAAVEPPPHSVADPAEAEVAGSANPEAEGSANAASAGSFDAEATGSANAEAASGPALDQGGAAADGQDNAVRMDEQGKGAE